MDVPDFTNREKAEAWLAKQPREWSLAIAARAALRVLPLLHRLERSIDDAVYQRNMVLPLLRGAALPWVGALVSTHGRELSVASAPFAFATFAASAAATAASRASAAFASAAGSAEAAASADAPAYAAFASARASAAFTASRASAAFAASRASAAFAASPAAAAADAVDASATSAFAAFAATHASRDLAAFAAAFAASTDAGVLAASGSARLALAQLWLPSGDPGWALSSRHAFRVGLIARAEHWSPWLDWLDAVTEGRAPWGLPAVAVEHVLVTALNWPEEDWEQGPDHVNPKLLELVAAEQGKLAAATPPAQDAQRDFFVSYSHRDEAMAREIVEVVESLGHSVFVRFQDMPNGSNFVIEMQRGLGSTSRFIAVLSPSYEASDQCKAEWAAAYNMDPAGAKRKILSFLIAPAQLEPLARQVVYTSLVGKTKDERRLAILAALKPPTPNVAGRELAERLAAVASPDASISTEGKLDAGPNPVADKPVDGKDLSTLPAHQRDLAEAIASALPRNAPPVVAVCLRAYSKHLAERGAQPIVGLLGNYASALEAECRSPDFADWGPGLEQLFMAFLALDSQLRAHFPLSEPREKLLAATPIDEDAATGSTLVQPIADVAQAIADVAEEGKATQAIVDISGAMTQTAKDVSSLPPSAPDTPSTIITPKRRFVLGTLGFYERIYAAVGSTASIASTPQGMALLEHLRTAIQALLRLVI